MKSNRIIVQKFWGDYYGRTQMGHLSFATDGQLQRFCECELLVILIIL